MRKYSKTIIITELQLILIKEDKKTASKLNMFTQSNLNKTFWFLVF